MQKIRWGVLSTAKIARTKVIPAIQSSERGEVVAIASRRFDSAQAAARDLGIARAHDSYEALLADPAVDAIYNPLPNHLHVPWSIKALEAGKHVLCEKPIGLNSADLEQLLAAAAKRPELKLMEAFMYRFHPQWDSIKPWLAKDLGQVRLINAFFGYNNRNADDIRNLPDIGGGGLMDIGCYGISLARLVYGCEPQRVIASLRPLPGYQVDCLATAMLEFPEGIATFTASTKTEPTQWAEIHGEAGLMRLEKPFNPEPGQDAKVHLQLSGAHQSHNFCEGNQYQLMADAFAKSIQDNTPVPTPLSDAQGNMRVLDALFASSRENRWIEINA
ncbi:Gfo/Idh/MocA family protein [Marinimicrobium sp. ABcell2]|uniref:Gfo/Idh/MocA family protein n=1 Tax=Marinimicrobium sp. ABcell2 TaxID=3069751 RepID=UPI0027B71632|nr:Gfo/Idh/MocA family oxidoreductase [Marinimicrobium sp. ABcell2]MDQ2078150.1 Gfo/Idh/MocA family oxidoreductase [Marinimicrobium sp. ABcell2]